MLKEVEFDNTTLVEENLDLKAVLEEKERCLANLQLPGRQKSNVRILSMKRKNKRVSRRVFEKG